MEGKGSQFVNEEKTEPLLFFVAQQKLSTQDYVIYRGTGS